MVARLAQSHILEPILNLERNSNFLQQRLQVNRFRFLGGSFGSACRSSDYWPFIKAYGVVSRYQIASFTSRYAGDLQPWTIDVLRGRVVFCRVTDEQYQRCCHGGGSSSVGCVRRFNGVLVGYASGYHTFQAMTGLASNLGIDSNYLYFLAFNHSTTNNTLLSLLLPR
jgi:hypothetical protein